MRAWLIFICCSQLCLIGCKSLQPGGTRPDTRMSQALSAQEEAFANALAHFGQGLLHEATQGRDSLLALNELQAAAKADSGNHNLLSRIAVIALHRKTPDVAVAALERSYRFDPKSYERCVDLAAVYHAAAMHEQAIKAYHRALKRDRSQTSVYIALAGLHFEKGESNHAFQILEKGRKYGSDIGLIHLFAYEQAKRFLSRGAIDMSIACFERLAMWDEKRRSHFYQLLSEIHIANHDLPSAIHVLKQATAFESSPPDAFINLAALLLPIDQEQGLSVLQHARERFKDHPAILFALGCAYSDMEDYAKAIPLFEEARRGVAEMEAENDHPNLLTEAFYITHGAAYERSGLIEQAERVFQECLTHYPNSDRTLNYLAYMLAEHRIKLDEALDYVNRALKIEADNPAYLDTLGWIYFQQERFEDALKEIDAARAIMPDDPEILMHMGDVYHAMGNRKQSHFFWKRSFIMDTTNAAMINKLQENGIDIETVLHEAELPPRRSTNEN